MLIFVLGEVVVSVCFVVCCGVSVVSCESLLGDFGVEGLGELVVLLLWGRVVCVILWVVLF